MLYKVIKYVDGTNDLDLSDWITDIGKVPFITKNHNRTLVAEGYDFKYSSKSPYELAKGDKILFYRDTVLVHNGIIEKIDFDEEALLYRIQVRHLLNVLRDRNTYMTRQFDIYSNPLSFMDLLLANSTETTIGTLAFDMITYKGLINLIVNECENAGTSLDWTTHYTNNDFSWKSIEAGDNTLTVVQTPTVNEDKLYFLAQQINCTGVNGIYAPIEFDEEMNASKPSLFEILSLLVCLRGLSFIPKDAFSFYVVSQKSAVGSYFEDDELYQINTEDELNAETGVEIAYGTLGLPNWFSSDIQAYDNNTMYFNGDLVTYEGHIYRASFGYYNSPDPETGGIIGIPPTDTLYWYMTVIDPEVRAYIEPVTQDMFEQYNYKWGVKCTTGEWLDNFNPIVIDDDTAYFCLPIPTVYKWEGDIIVENESCAYYITKDLMESYKKTTAEVPAGKIFGVDLLEYESVYVADINNDTCEIEVAQEMPITSEFNPYTTYGYLANDYPENILGTIDEANNKWLDINNKDGVAKYFESNSIKTLTLYNRKFIALNYFGDLGENNYVTLHSQADLFAGQSNIVVTVAFKLPSTITTQDHTIFALNIIDSNYRFALKTHPDGIKGLMTDGTNEVLASTSQYNYEDNQWHIVVCSFNQSDKTVTLITDKNENTINMIKQNNSYVPLDFSTKTVYSNIGDEVINNYYPQDFFGIDLAEGEYALLGDLLISLTTLTTAQVNYNCQRIAQRLGITWIPTSTVL